MQHSDLSEHWIEGHQLAATAVGMQLLTFWLRDTGNACAHASADSGFSARWIEGHQLAAAAIGKPLLMEEFGKIATGGASNFTAVRDPIYRTVYGAVNDSIAADRPLRGALFWEWNPDGQSRGDRAIEIGDTAWTLVQQNGLQQKARNGAPVAGCTPYGAPAAAAAAPAASPPPVESPPIKSPPAKAPAPPPKSTGETGPAPPAGHAPAPKPPNVPLLTNPLLPGGSVLTQDTAAAG